MNMKTTTALGAFALIAVLPMHAADKKTSAGAEIEHPDVVESGTYQVTAHKVDPEEKEIYVKTADGKTIELYLKSQTELTKGGKKVGFAALKEGQKLEIKVEKKGKKLNPLAVKIAE